MILGNEKGLRGLVTLSAWALCSCPKAHNCPRVKLEVAAQACSLRAADDDQVGAA